MRCCSCPRLLVLLSNRASMRCMCQETPSTVAVRAILIQAIFCQSRAPASARGAGFMPGPGPGTVCMPYGMMQALGGRRRRGVLEDRAAVRERRRRIGRLALPWRACARIAAAFAVPAAVFGAAGAVWPAALLRRVLADGLRAVLRTRGSGGGLLRARGAVGGPRGRVGGGGGGGGGMASPIARPRPRLTLSSPLFLAFRIFLWTPVAKLGVLVVLGGMFALRFTLRCVDSAGVGRP